MSEDMRLCVCVCVFKAPVNAVVTSLSLHTYTNTHTHRFMQAFLSGLDLCLFVSFSGASTLTKP